jgi:hypothetical protein
VVIASMVSDYILAVLSALASVAGSIYAIKAIVRHEMKQCDLRMDALREGLDRNDKNS